MVGQSAFAASVGAWAAKALDAAEVIFQESAQELVSQLDLLLKDMVYDQPVSPSGYHRTGFLRASLTASKTVMPKLVRENPGGTYPPDLGDVVLVINSAELGDALYIGYTANYAAFVHYGARGREPRPWVTLVAQRWDQIVKEKETEVKTRLGLA
jgi:hypothetical protein